MAPASQGAGFEDFTVCGGQMEQTDVRLVKRNKFGASGDGLDQNVHLSNQLGSTKMLSLGPPLGLGIILNLSYNANFCALFSRTIRF